MQLGNVLLVGAAAAGVYFLLRPRTVAAAPAETQNTGVSDEWFNYDFLSLDYWLGEAPAGSGAPLTTENAFDDGNWITDSYESATDWLSGTWDSIWE